MKQATVRDYISIGKIYLDGARELQLNEELTDEQLDSIRTRCTTMLAYRKMTKKNNHKERKDGKN